MKRQTCGKMVLPWAACAALGWVGEAHAAQLWMQWRELGPDDREFVMRPGETTVIDIYFQMNEGDSLSALTFSNIFVPSISQAGTEARPGWDAGASINGVLGGGLQRAAFAGPTLFGPGEFLIGSQTIRVDDVGDGSPKQIMYSVCWFGCAQSDPELLDGKGNPYFVSPFPTDTVGSYSIGAGFPNTIICDFGPPCPPDPLVLNFVHPDPDCNGNFILDAQDLAAGTSLDGDGVPDTCVQQDPGPIRIR